MKRIYTLLTLLLLVCAGAWADTYPATGAYPVEGKIYFLYANEIGNTTRHYVYWDNTNSVLKNSTTKADTDYYKWTVSISDGLYIITNVGTGTKLTWDSALTLGVGSSFDLSKQIYDSACVPLWTSGPGWTCLKNDTETFASNYKYASYPGNPSGYSYNFVFEEVLSAHSLVNGAYYTIYCDNDSKQYIYDNFGTLAISNSSSSDLNYVWQCIENGDYYNFRNVLTGKYLSHKAISTSANNFVVETTDVYHDGCVKLKTGSNYMGCKVDNTFDQASHGRFYKVISDYSFDFRFDVVDLSNYLVGTNLGGTLNNPTAWSNTWTSGTSPSFTMTSSAANINTTANNTGGMDIRSGKDLLTATYTITAPTGYVITGYKLFGYALNGNQTVTPAEGGSAVVFTSAGNSISVSGIKKASASFTLAGANNGLFLRAMQVSLSPLSGLTTLPTANNKAYIITNARGTWNFADDATTMTAVTAANTNLDAVAQQIALVYRGSNYYLYSVNAGKYLTASNTLTSIPTDNEQVTITPTADTNYPWFFSFKNVSDKNINIGGSINLVINNYNTPDAGNKMKIVEATDFDYTDALNKFTTHSVTYKLSYGGNSTFRTVSDVTTTLSSSASEFVPSSFLNDCVSLSYSPATISSETTEVTVTATWNGPFELSNSFAEAKWYTVGIQSNLESSNYIWKNENNALKAVSVATDDYASLADANCFAFVGNPYDGITIYNKAAGSSNSVYKANDNSQATLATTGTLFVPKASKASGKTVANGYCCFQVKDGRYYFNCYTNDGYKVRGYDDNDAGSTCWFIPAGKYYLNFIDGLCLDAPVGAVGTKEYFVNHPTDVSTINSLRSTIESSLYSDMTSLSSFNLLLNPVKNTSTIALGDGYYRIVNAYHGFPVKPTVYFDSTLGKMKWSVASNTSDNVNSIVRITTETPSIYVPNAQKYMKLARTDNDQIGDVAGTTTFTSLGDAQYKITIGGQVLHSFGHNEGAGTADVLVGWDGGLNTASAWYIVKVSELPVGLHTIDEVAYATTCLPFDVTISNANAYTMVENGDWLVPTQLEGNKVPAGTAVLLKGTSATATATINTGNAFSTSNENALLGTYVPMDFELTEEGATATATAEYFLGVYSGAVGFYRSEVVSKSGYYTLGANKAYLPSASAGARGFAINWDDEVTGIRSIDNGKQSVKNGAFYDLQGRKVANPSRGMYIINGRKVVIK